MRKRKVAAGAPMLADDPRVPMIRRRLDEGYSDGRSGNKLAALRAYRDRMLAAHELYASDPAAAVAQATEAAFELNEQIGIGHAQRPLIGVLAALEDRIIGRLPAWLRPESSGGTNRLGSEERIFRALAVATLERLCDDNVRVKEATRRVSSVIGESQDTLSDWREQIANSPSAGDYAELLSRTRLCDVQEALAVLQRAAEARPAAIP